MAGYCTVKHKPGQHFKLGSWACRYCNFNFLLNSHVSVPRSVVFWKTVSGNIAQKKGSMHRNRGRTSHRRLIFHLATELWISGNSYFYSSHHFTTHCSKLSILHAAWNVPTNSYTCRTLKKKKTSRVAILLLSGEFYQNRLTRQSKLSKLLFFYSEYASNTWSCCCWFHLHICGVKYLPLIQHLNGH